MKLGGRHSKFFCAQERLLGLFASCNVTGSAEPLHRIAILIVDRNGSPGVHPYVPSKR